MRAQLSSSSLLFFLLPAVVAAQSSAPGPSSQPAPPISVTVHLVTVDVVVREYSLPVHGLTREDFIVLEDGHPQTISFFEPHTAADDSTPADVPRVPSLPPDTYTNLPVTHVTDSVTVLRSTASTPRRPISYLSVAR